jgi:hypothetical protein
MPSLATRGVVSSILPVCGGAWGHRYKGLPPEHGSLTQRAVGRKGRRLGAPRTFLVADPDMALPCWVGQVAMRRLGAARLLLDVKTVPGWPGR